jgi:hypothetical protein
MWRFLSIFGLFIVAMGTAIGIHDGNLILGLGLAAVMLAVLLPLVFFSFRFAERSAPGDVFRFIKIAVILGVTLTCIAGIIGMVIHQKEKESNQASQPIAASAAQAER